MSVHQRRVIDGYSKFCGLTKLGAANRMNAGTGVIVDGRSTGTLAAVHNADSRTDDDGVGIGTAGVASTG